MRGHLQQNNLLSDYCDGQVYQSHPLFSEDKHALQLIMYYDDVEVCNPLGSRAKTHKLGTVHTHHVYIICMSVPKRMCS